MTKTLRNVLIIIAIAAAVAFLPGGGDSAQLVYALLGIALTVIFVLLGIRFYRENRVALFSLGDKHRALLYGGIGLLVLALAGRSWLIGSGIGTLAFIVMLVAAAGALYAVWQHHRAYGY